MHARYRHDIEIPLCVFSQHLSMGNRIHLAMRIGAGVALKVIAALHPFVRDGFWRMLDSLFSYFIQAFVFGLFFVFTHLPTPLTFQLRRTTAQSR